MAGDGVLLVGHGSREGAANAELEALVDAYRRRRPDLRVEIGYIELARPSVAEALAALGPEVGRLGVVPLLLFAAGHARNDVPRAIAEARARFPSLPIAAAPVLGVHPALIETAAARAATALGNEPWDGEGTLLLVVGRGSSDASASDDFREVSRRIGQHLGLLHVEAAFLSVAQPSVDDALERAAHVGPARLVVLPYLLFAGQLVAKLRHQVSAFAADQPALLAQVVPHLGIDDRILDLVDERAREALARSHEAGPDGGGARP